MDEQQIAPRMDVPAWVAFGTIIIGGLANIGFVGIFENHQMAAWIATLIAATVLTACIGKAINHRWSGVIINSRNMLSLSKLQMVAWTILILSTLITAAAHNIHAGNPVNALDITIDSHLLIVMGISTTSLVASPAVLSLKSGNDGQPAVAVKDTPSDASWLDIFRSDMADAADTPDLSKIQQFLVTLVVLSAYAVMIGKMFASFADCKSCSCLFVMFPPLSEQIVWLIGISHAGYIAYKAVPKPPAAATVQAAAAVQPGAQPDDGAVG
jgi:hypothetical protein